MGEWPRARLRREWDHVCDACPRAPFDVFRRERCEDRVRSGVGTSGERACRRPAGTDRSSGVRRACCGNAANLRSAGVLAGGSGRPCRVHAARVRDHRIGAARGSGDVCKRSGEAGLRCIGHTGSLGRRHHSDRVQVGGQRSPSPVRRRHRCLRARRNRVVAAPRPLHPHHRAPVRILHRLRNRGVASTGSSCETAGKPSGRLRGVTRGGSPESLARQETALLCAR